MRNGFIAQSLNCPIAAIFAFILFVSLSSYAGGKSAWTYYKTWAPSDSTNGVKYHFVYDATDGDASLGIWQESPEGLKRFFAGKNWIVPSKNVTERDFETVTSVGKLDHLIGEVELVGCKGNVGFAYPKENEALIFLTSAGVMKTDAVGAWITIEGVKGSSDFYTFYFTYDEGSSDAKAIIFNSAGEHRIIEDVVFLEDRNKSAIFEIEGLRSESKNLIKIAAKAFKEDIGQRLVFEPPVDSLVLKNEPVPTPHESVSLGVPTEVTVAHESADESQAEHEASEETVDPNDIEAKFEGLTDAKVLDAEGRESSAFQQINLFATNLTNNAKRKMYRGYAPNEEVSIRLAKGLLKKERGSVALLGPAGSGKSSDVMGFVQQVVDTEKYADLKKYTFIEISVPALGSGTQYTGQMETKVNALLALSRANNIIWVIDEFHQLRGVGTHSHNSNDIIESMKSDLASGQLRMIGMSTEEEFWQTYEGDSALKRRFTVFTRKEPAGEEVTRIISSWVAKHKLSLPNTTVLAEVVRLSSVMNPEGAQPDKSIALLEEIYANLRLKNSASPPELADVRMAALDLYGMNPADLDPSKGAERIQKLQAHLDEMVIGHSEVKKAIVEQTKHVFADVHDNSKPRIMALFTGPKGRGKTELAIAYAVGLGLPYHIIEMNSFATAASFNRVGLMEAIAQGMTKNAFTVLIFDEIEKAPIEVQNELLRMLNNGEFNLTVGAKGGTGAKVLRKINARNTTVFFTSNAASDVFNAKATIGFTGGAAAETIKRVSSSQLEADNVSGVLLDRMNLILPFGNQTKDEFRRVLESHLNRTIKNIESRLRKTVALDGQAQFIDQAVAKYFAPDMSNREALRIIQQSVRGVLAEALLKSANEPSLTLKYDGKEFVYVPKSIECKDLLRPAS